MDLFYNINAYVENAAVNEKRLGDFLANQINDTEYRLSYFKTDENGNAVTNEDEFFSVKIERVGQSLTISVTQNQIETTTDLSVELAEYDSMIDECVKIVNVGTWFGCNLSPQICSLVNYPKYDVCVSMMYVVIALMNSPRRQQVNELLSRNLRFQTEIRKILKVCGERKLVKAGLEKVNGEWQGKKKL